LLKRKIYPTIRDGNEIKFVSENKFFSALPSRYGKATAFQKIKPTCSGAT
jgi:hypothetical protein